jgi:hypothetical protein
LLPVSATYTLPLASTAIAVGSLSSPLPLPDRPNSRSFRPDAEYSTMRFAPLSVTHTSPLPSTAMPAGLLRPPANVPLYVGAGIGLGLVTVNATGLASHV